jgi:ABC-type oligopeptide transport system ATPase subunit
MPGTREDVLTHIKTWLYDLNEPNIFWLSGSPGSGKTTIASTVVADFHCFSGQFFFRRDEVELQDPDNLWRRIALDLALGYKDVRMSIAQALEAQKANIRGFDISMQFEHLIAKPLQEVFTTSVEPLLIVVDALDECGSYEKLLPSLTSWSYLPKSLKLLITSRRYSDIQFSLSSVSVHCDLHTGHEISTQTSDDLQKYFIARFSEVTRLPPKWPGPAKVSLLVRKAAGLFIWAKSAMDFILHKGGDPEERLNIISAGSGEGIDAVDGLYHQVISVALQGLRKPEETALRLVLGSIVIAKNPLRTGDLKELLGVKDALLDSIMSQLSPVLSINDVNYLRVCHQSVTDFLLNSERSQDLWVDPQLCSLRFAGYCLKFMNGKLKFNFFDLKTSYVLNKDIPELNDHIKSIKSTALDHASCFWASYLKKDCDKMLQLEVQAAVDEFLMVHCLHWLEIMSLMGTVNHAAQLLLLAASWSRVSYIYIYIIAMLTTIKNVGSETQHIRLCK